MSPRADAPAAATLHGPEPVTCLPGVGPTLAGRLAGMGIECVRDLWFHLPLRYEDRTRLTPIAQLAAGAPAQVEGRVAAVERGFRYRPLLRVALEDDSGATLTLRFFHFRAAQVAQFEPGAWFRAYGEVRYGSHGPEMVHPRYRRLAEQERGQVGDRLDPIYPAAEGVGQATLLRLVGRALDRLPAPEQLELLPTAVLAQLHLPSLDAALRTVHRPPVGSDLDAFARGVHPAQQRLAFEELLAHQLSLRRQRLSVRSAPAPRIQGPGRLAQALRRALPFRLTAAQRRVVAEVQADLKSREPMMRLVQGDVGSGKTVVAALAAARVIEAGHQVALMAPTELLAEQHAHNLAAWFAPLQIEPVWLSGKVKGKARSSALARIAAGAPLTVGTHALMQEGVGFARLGLAIIDEQHRFGVHQRLRLRDKGAAGEGVPHQLVMTATPIPRTLAMTAYADLDVSVIDALPPGRTPVRTVVIGAGRRGEVIERIRASGRAGRQVYWVCTLIEDSEEIDAQAAEATFQALCSQLPDLRVGLLHGRLKPAQKQAVMAAFQRGGLDLLVATTVIEVGVDVSNASLMIVENAERLGLAQLHQLRGRVGRGAEASTCVLMYQAPLSEMARQRLALLRRSNDGFEIAEKDLQLRGPGELLGTRQTGLPGFRIADLVRDARWLPAVRDASEALLAQAPATADALIERWVGAAERYAAA
ncbi:MAG TPA: ATP-dependent DNA helicase RecG [Xanthomonadaceae bacterium]|nr:ATP-dependent DNA helicase RecG [Xanthomonadaceae bacterium]